jgi:hypothetical protein
MWLGALPAWTTNRQVAIGLHSDRFGMASMFWASLVLIAIFSWLVTSYKKQLLLACTLVAIATSLSIQTDNQYRWGWVSENRFFWQLAWRAPYIQPHTVFVSSGEVLGFMGNAITGALNVAYSKTGMPENEFQYTYISLDRDYVHNMTDFLNGAELSVKMRNFTFSGNTKDSLVIDYGSTPNTCLHILTPNDVHLPGLPELTAQAVPNSNLSRILPTPLSSDYPPLSIYGPEPPHAWCYFYEKADLARQLGDWKGAAQLGDQAQAKGYSPLNADSTFEWQPFIEAYARTGQWQQASSLSLKAYQRDVRSDAGLCDLWDRLAADSTLSGQERDAAANAVRQGLKCPTK